MVNFSSSMHLLLKKVTQTKLKNFKNVMKGRDIANQPKKKKQNKKKKIQKKERKENKVGMIA